MILKYPILKNLVDRILALLLIILLLPFLIFLSILIRYKMGKPILFIQERSGFKGSPFKLYKFRTMLNLYDSNNNLLPDKLRLNSFGLWLRSYSIDELPTLINVLKGEISFIGPRPLRHEYFSLYTEEQSRRLLVKPGITGLAQISGRNIITWEKKFEYDIKYFHNQSFLLDLKIFFITFTKVFKREGINNKSKNYTTWFKGSKN